MDNIKVFTAIGAVVAFSGYAPDVFGAVNSDNEHSAVEDSLGYWGYERVDCISDADAGKIGQYEVTGPAESTVKAKGMEKLDESNGGGNNVEETPTYSGYDDLLEYAQNSEGNPDGSGFHINSPGSKNASIPIWKTEPANRYQCAGPRQSDTTTVIAPATCDTSNGYRQTNSSTVNGVTTLTCARSNYCKPEDKVYVYYCPEWYCHACDICNAGSYNICAISYDDYKPSENDKCNLDAAIEWYEKFVSWLDGLEGSIVIRDARAKGNFFAGTRAYHILGKKGESSENIRLAYITAGERLLSAADPEWADIANFPAGSATDRIAAAIDLKNAKEAKSGSAGTANPRSQAK